MREPPLAEWWPKRVSGRPHPCCHKMVCWEAIDDNNARATVNHKQLSQSIDISVAADGQPLTVLFLRWSNANPKKLINCKLLVATCQILLVLKAFACPPT